MEQFKSESDTNWIKFAIKRNYSIRVKKSKNNTLEFIYDQLNIFLNDNFEFNSLHDKWFETPRERTKGFIHFSLISDLHGYQVWNDEKANELVTLFLAEFNEKARFFLNTHHENVISKMNPADPRDPVWELGVVAFDNKIIGGIWSSINYDPHTIRIPASFLEKIKNEKY